MRPTPARDKDTGAPSRTGEQVLSFFFVLRANLVERLIVGDVDVFLGCCAPGRVGPQAATSP